MTPTPEEVARLERWCRLEDEANCPVIAGRMLTNEPEMVLEHLIAKDHPECDLNGHSWTPSGMRSICSVCGTLNKL